MPETKQQDLSRKKVKKVHKYQEAVWTCCGSDHPYSNTMAKMLFLLAVFFIPASGMSVDANHMSDQELVDYLNTNQHFFKAEVPTMSYEKFKSHLMDPKYMKIPEGTKSFNSKWKHKCDGGYMLTAFQYGMTSGVCTGGAYNAKNCCKPYPFHPCGQHKDQPYYGECEKDNEDTPTCRAQFSKELKVILLCCIANSAYFVYADEDAIRNEIFTNGPVQAAFDVYNDFRFYNNGVYVHTWGEQAGGHAVKIIGWGVENGVKYWLVSNSWSSDWGEDGLFKIRRGTNECEIEAMVGAVIMNA
ncbi:unnamed protein product [Cylicocyclus nassatus]|uniref:Peptidase C1A papain C-terminal domain-containing protein n=1 Tax=Cylicocyclus nassatus TaxID=53992 RepID=A0AA36M164_CYLNA|nr:unnamed protein product [Cylicocyclus nassatus]